jgi:hypothetical protein
MSLTDTAYIIPAAISLQHASLMITFAVDTVFSADNTFMTISTELLCATDTTSVR